MVGHSPPAPTLTVNAGESDAADLHAAFDRFLYQSECQGKRLREIAGGYIESDDPGDEVESC